MLSKTRMCPPCTTEEAALLARAALEDTLAAVRAIAGIRRVVALEGVPGPWLGPGFDVMVQRGDDLADRLAAALGDVGGPVLAIAGDIPQVTPALIAAGLRVLGDPRVDAVVGPALDGGYWAIGLRRADPEVFAGVPMSVPETLAAQRARFRALGLRAVDLPSLRDVDRLEDAVVVAEEIPGSRFATALQPVLRRLGVSAQDQGPDVRVPPQARLTPPTVLDPA